MAAIYESSMTAKQSTTKEVPEVCLPWASDVVLHFSVE